MRSLLFLIFLESLTIGMTFSLVIPLLLKTGESSFLSESVSLNLRGLLLGINIICFTAGQFICSPLLGYISASKGHKNTMLFLFILAAIAYVIGTISVIIRSVTLLFIFKFLIGISNSSRPLFQTAMTYGMSEEKKAKLYGWIGASSGLGFISGSFLTQLGIEMFSMLTRYTFFFVTSAIISICNCIFIARSLHHLPPINQPDSLSLQEGFHELKNLMRKPYVKPIFSIVLFYFCAWELFYTFTPICLIRYLEMPVEQTTSFYTFANFWGLIGNGVLAHWSSRFSNQAVLMIAAPIWSVVLFLAGCTTLPSLFWGNIALIAALGSSLNCTLSAFLTDQLDTQHHGSALGISQALQCIARLLPSFALTSFLIHYPAIPLQGSALAFLLTLYLAWKLSAYSSTRATL